MRSGVVILNYNNAFETIKCANQFVAMECIDEIAIVDNNSSDNSRYLLDKNTLPKTKVICNDKNSGYAEGNNIGLRYLAEKQMDVVFVSNPDVVVEEKAVRQTINFLINNHDFGCAAPRTIDKDLNPVVLYGNHIVSFKEAVLSNFLSRKFVVERRLKQDTSSLYQEQSFLYGSFWGATVEALNNCEYMDPNTFLYREEEILAARMRKKGYKLAYLLDVNYVHKHEYKMEKCKKKIKDMIRLQRSDLYYWSNYSSLTKPKEFLLRFSYLFCIATHFIVYQLEDLFNGK